MGGWAEYWEMCNEEERMPKVQQQAAAATDRLPLVTFYLHMDFCTLDTDYAHLLNFSDCLLKRAWISWRLNVHTTIITDAVCDRPSREFVIPVMCCVFFGSSYGDGLLSNHLAAFGCWLLTFMVRLHLPCLVANPPHARAGP